MGIYEGRVDLLEKYDFSAGVIARRLEKMIAGEHAPIPVNVYRKGARLFEMAKMEAGQDDNPHETLGTYRMAMHLLHVTGIDSCKTFKGIDKSLALLKEIYAATESGNLDEKMREEAKRLQRFFSTLKNESSQHEAGRFYDGKGSEFGYLM